MRLLAFLTFTASLLPFARAALPVAPSNLIAFPDRDFVTIEGFAERVGQKMLLEVFRGTTVVGSALGTVSGTDVAFEINHPGGVCWGEGTGLKVTPDIIPGDRIAVSINGQVLADSTVQNVAIEKIDYVPGSRVFTITGNVAAGIPLANTEVRVINPSLTATVVGRRDMRAVAGDYTTRAFANGYRSGIVESTLGSVRKFVATFEVAANAANAVSVATTAATGGGARVLTWLAPANQGLTISEFGETGGPGMSGCPAGPTNQPPTAGAFAAVFSSAGQVKVSWTPAVPIPGTSPVTAYDIIVVPKPAAATRQTMGFRTDASVNTVTVANLPAGASFATHDIEVRSLAGVRTSDPFAISGGTGTFDPVVNIVLTASPPENTADPTAVVTATSVTFSSNVQIYYTVGATTKVMTGDMPSNEAIVYNGQPIPISTKTVLHIAAIHASGQFETKTITYQPPGGGAAPQVPQNLKAVAAPASAILTWTAPADPTITGYAAQRYVLGANNQYVESGPLQDATGGEVLDKRMTVAGLAAGTPAFFALKSKNAAGIYSAATPVVSVTPSEGIDVITITRARQSQRDLRVEGTGSDQTATISVFANCNNAPCTTVLATSTIDATGAFAARAKTAPAGIQSVFAKSNKGGVFGPFAVTQN
ncbi:hypothetical protein DFJ77DRAFT_312140 [Powellomyces hirtus]|nr:hypothetical protein DFJ77DRAFT_312140 [Powellomyces hirtus]